MGAVRTRAVQNSSLPAQGSGEGAGPQWLSERLPGAWTVADPSRASSMGPWTMEEELGRVFDPCSVN